MLARTAFVLLLAATAATAQHAHSPGMTHAAPAALPSEPGQGAFAALSEIVLLLEADSGTDWESVDLDALRAHLVDMDRVAIRAVVVNERTEDGLRATATGDPETVAALRRMVPAHATQLDADDRWSARGKATDEGAVLTVAAADPATVARIHGLGFFGLMASQDHHRAHHLALATGASPH